MFAVIRSSLLSFCLLISACANEAQLDYLAEDAIILAFGDSLTYGTGAKPNFSYPAQLEKLINRKVINAGIPGEISSKGLRRLPALLSTHKPDLVILCHGANDILRKLDLNKTKSNLQNMILLIKKSGSQVIILAVPNFSLFLSPPSFYSELASANNTPLLDDTLGGILLNAKHKSDQIHPNASGYKIIANNIKDLLEKTGGLRQSSN